MPYADPDREAAYQAEYRRQRPWLKGGRHVPEPPISRQAVLDEDVAQQRELARLEGRRIGHKRAQERLAEWIAAERRWIRHTYRPPSVEEDVA